MLLFIYLPATLYTGKLLQRLQCKTANSLEARKVQILMENMQLLAAAFAQDQEHLNDMIDMHDKLNHTIGVILISNVSQCPECGGNLIVRKDRYSKVTLYSKSMGTVFAQHYYKYCKNNRHECNVSQHYGYYTVGDRCTQEHL